MQFLFPLRKQLHVPPNYPSPSSPTPIPTFVSFVTPTTPQNLEKYWFREPV
jgi:hypothetical protein